MGLGAFGKQPDVIIMPYTPKQIEVLASTNNDWAILCTSMTGRFEIHYPASPWLQFVMRNLVYPRITRTVPIPGAVNVFTDGFKGSVRVVYVEGNQPQAHVFPYQSAQAVVGAVSICFLHYSYVRNVCNLCSVSEFFQSCKSVKCNWCNVATQR